MPSNKVFTRSIPKKKRRHRCSRNKYSPPQPSKSVFKTRNYWKPKITLPVNSQPKHPKLQKPNKGSVQQN